MVPRAGLEPARPFGLGILSPLCLPFHHRGDCVFAGVLRVTHNVAVGVDTLLALGYRKIPKPHGIGQGAPVATPPFFRM